MKNKDIFNPAKVPIYYYPEDGHWEAEILLDGAKIVDGNMDISQHYNLKIYPKSNVFRLEIQSDGEIFEESLLYLATQKHNFDLYHSKLWYWMMTVAAINMDGSFQYFPIQEDNFIVYNGSGHTVTVQTVTRTGSVYLKLSAYIVICSIDNYKTERPELCVLEHGRLRKHIDELIESKAKLDLNKEFPYELHDLQYFSFGNNERPYMYQFEGDLLVVVVPEREYSTKIDLLVDVAPEIIYLGKGQVYETIKNVLWERGLLLD